MNDDLFDPATGACIGLNLRKAARWITQFYEKKMEPSGVKITQFGLLVAIDTLNAPTINELAECFNLDRTTLSRNLRPLERHDWITITPGRDKRIRAITLTAEGTAAMARAKPCWQAAQAEALEIFGQDAWLDMKGRLDNANEELKKALTE